MEPAFGVETDVGLTLGKHALQMAKPALSVELTTTFPESVSRQVPLNKNNQGELPNGKLMVGGETTEHLATGPNQNPRVNKTYICCRRQMINTLWTTILMTTKNSATPWKHGKYTASTQTTQRKNTLLHCPCLQQGTNSPQ